MEVARGYAAFRSKDKQMLYHFFGARATSLSMSMDGGKGPSSLELLVYTRPPSSSLFSPWIITTTTANINNNNL